MEPEVHRKHLHRREVHLGPRYLTCSCYHRLPLFHEEWTRDLFVEVLAQARDKHKFRLIAFVVMPEHTHMILIPTAGLGTGSDIPTSLQGIKKAFSQRILHQWRQTSDPVLDKILDEENRPRFWQPGGGFDRNIRDPDELIKAIDYIHKNPVTRGLVQEPTHWKWSSARWFAGQRDGILPMDQTDGSRLP